MPKLKMLLTLFANLIILSYAGYIIYQYFPNKYQSITSFCVSDATLQKWLEYFQKNDNKYTVRLLPDKSKPEQDLLFNSEQVRQTKQIKSIPAKPQFITIPCQKPLKVIKCNEDNLDETLEENREHPGYLKVIVELNSPKLGLADMVRKVCPQALIVEAKYLRTEQALPELPENYKFDPIEEFQRFYLKRQGAEVPTEVLEVFAQLHQQLQQETTDALA